MPQDAYDGMTKADYEAQQKRLAQLRAQQQAAYWAAYDAWAKQWKKSGGTSPPPPHPSGNSSSPTPIDDSGDRAEIEREKQRRAAIERQKRLDEEAAKFDAALHRLYIPADIDIITNPLPQTNAEQAQAMCLANEGDFYSEHLEVGGNSSTFFAECNYSDDTPCYRHGSGWSKWGTESAGGTSTSSSGKDKGQSDNGSQSQEDDQNNSSAMTNPLDRRGWLIDELHTKYGWSKAVLQQLTYGQLELIYLTGNLNSPFNESQWSQSVRNMPVVPTIIVLGSGVVVAAIVTATGVAWLPVMAVGIGAGGIAGTGYDIIANQGYWFGSTKDIKDLDIGHALQTGLGGMQLGFVMTVPGANSSAFIMGAASNVFGSALLGNYAPGHSDSSLQFTTDIFSGGVGGLMYGATAGRIPLVTGNNMVARSALAGLSNAVQGVTSDVSGIVLLNDTTLDDITLDELFGNIPGNFALGGGASFLSDTLIMTATENGLLRASGLVWREPTPDNPGRVTIQRKVNFESLAGYPSQGTSSYQARTTSYYGTHWSLPLTLVGSNTVPGYVAVLFPEGLVMVPIADFLIASGLLSESDFPE